MKNKIIILVAVLYFLLQGITSTSLIKAQEQRLAPVSIDSLTADAICIDNASYIKLSWSATNAIRYRVTTSFGVEYDSSNDPEISKTNSVQIPVGNAGGETFNFTLYAYGSEKLYGTPLQEGMGINSKSISKTSIKCPSSAAPAEIVTFVASPATIDKGQTTYLYWTIKNAQSIISNFGSGFDSIGPNDPNTFSNAMQVAPTQTTNYTITALGLDGKMKTAATTVTVNPTLPVARIGYFAPSGSGAINKGESTWVFWKVENAQLVSNDFGAEMKPVTNDPYTWEWGAQVTPTQTTTYNITALGRDGQTKTAKTTVTVKEAPPIPSLTPSKNYFLSGSYTKTIYLDALPGVNEVPSLSPGFKYLDSSVNYEKLFLKNENKPKGTKITYQFKFPDYIASAFAGTQGEQALQEYINTLPWSGPVESKNEQINLKEIVQKMTKGNEGSSFYNNLMIKINLTTDDSNITPSLDGFDISYQIRVETGKILAPTNVFSGYQSAYIGQNANPKLKSGESYQFEVQLKNVGDKTWSKNTIFLSTDRPKDRTPSFIREDKVNNNPSGWVKPNRIAMAEESVPFRGIANFKFWYTVPQNIPDGVYREYFRPIAENISDMEDYGIYWDITVDSGIPSRNPSDYHAQYISQNAYPTVKVGDSFKLEVKFKNTGTAAWYKNTVRLGTSRPFDWIPKFIREDKVNNNPSGWVSPNRVGMQEDKVKPGETATFSFWQTVPAGTTAKTYRGYYQPVADDITWMEDFGVYWDVRVR